MKEYFMYFLGLISGIVSISIIERGQPMGNRDINNTLTRRPNPLQKRGDTIVEVLICIAIMALAIGICYSLANRSLRSGISATNRSEATAVTQGQIELLKNASKNLSEAAFEAQFRQSGAYCLSQNPPSAGGGANPASYKATNCDFSNGYTVNVTYDSAKDTFVFTTNWDSLTGNGKDQQIIYYRIPKAAAAPAVLAAYCSSAPAVTATGATPQGGGLVNLGSIVNGNNCPTIYWIAYGPTPALGFMHGCFFEPPVYPGTDGSMLPITGINETWSNNGNRYVYAGAFGSHQWSKNNATTTISIAGGPNNIACNATINPPPANTTISLAGGGVAFTYVGNGQNSNFSIAAANLALTSNNGVVTYAGNISGLATGFYRVCAVNAANLTPICSNQVAF